MNKTYRTLKNTITAILAAIVMVGAFAVIPTTLAAPLGQDGDGSAGEQLDKRLENLYIREQNVRDAQSARITLAYDIILAMQSYANALDDIGVDVADLQAALDTFTSEVGAAEDQHQVAVDVLAAHEGFNDNGTVANREEAIQTLRDAGRALRDTHRSLTDATIKFRRAYIDWRQARADS